MKATGRTLLLCGCMLLFTVPAHADSQAQVRAAAMDWADGLSRGDPDVMVALYHEEAILHGTGSPVLRRGPEAIREYFAGSTGVELTMRFVEPMHIRVFGDVAVNTGNYAARVGQGEPVTLRYSFVYRRAGGEWLIIDHHSSRLPE